MTLSLPWVRVKLAMSLDGRTAMASGESQWITDVAARQDVQRLRARSGAILTGIGTLLEDDPSMNVRLSAAELGIDRDPAQPLRVVVDSQLRAPLNAKMYDLPGETVILGCVETDKSFAHQGVRVERIESKNGRVDLTAAMQWLAQQQVNEVHVEAGPELCGALLEAELVDEIIIYMAPHIMGDAARGLFHLPELAEMHQRIGLDISDIRAVGKDWRITAMPRHRYIEEL